MKYILVTGAASGIGKMITETMARRGWTVFASDISQEIKSFKAKNIIPISMDIRDEDSIGNAYREVAKHTLYLDVILNCAGINQISSLIEEKPEKINNVINTNLMGMVRVNKIFFPLLDKNAGRIVNISSQSGWITPPPFDGPYTISKHAVEAYNDCLRRELGLIGIKVIKIQPGSFKTPMHKKTIESFKELAETTKYFRPELKGISKILRKELKNTNNSRYLIKSIIKACESKNPKICYRVKNDKSRIFLNLFPEIMIDKIYKIKLDK